MSWNVHKTHFSCRSQNIMHALSNTSLASLSFLLSLSKLILKKIAACLFTEKAEKDSSQPLTCDGKFIDSYEALTREPSSTMMLHKSLLTGNFI